MPGAVVVHKRIYFSFAAELCPCVFGGQTMGTRALRWKGKKLATGIAALRRQLVLAQICPEGLRFQFIQKGSDFSDVASTAVAGLAHNAPKIKLACMHKLPPWPLTIPALASFTWRSGST